MNIPPNTRKHERTDHNSTLMLQVARKDDFIYVQAKDVSTDGIGFKTDYRIIPGTEVEIYSDHRRINKGVISIRARVIWCSLSDFEETAYNYQCGAAYL